MDLLKKNKLDQKVIFTGFVDYNDLPEFYAKSDIVVVRDGKVVHAAVKEGARQWNTLKELEKSLSIALEINEEHQRYNGKLQTTLTEVEEDNKKLSHQIEDKINKMRRSGM